MNPRQTQTNFSDFEKTLMRDLLDLAQAQLGKTTPNPVTAAAVYTADGIISKGVHQKAGSDHAEVVALKQAGAKAKGASLMVTLEPCSHHGKTPPCIDAIIAAGISEVIYAMEDPNPLVKQRSTDEVLEAAGIRVRKGLLQEEAAYVNRFFVMTHTQDRPYVTLKAGMSLDGKIALENGSSCYITGEESLKDVHKLRREHDAIMVGVGTILNDNPSLNVRYGLNEPGFSNPRKIIIDPNGQSLFHLKLFNAPNEGPVFIFTCDHGKTNLEKQEIPAHVFLIPISYPFQWADMTEYLYKKGITSILIEGGERVFTSALEQRIVDECVFYIAPKLIGGHRSYQVLERPVPSLQDTIQLDSLSIGTLGSDIRVSGLVRYTQNTNSHS